jgi:quinol monooxygenase YgiN
MLLRRVAIAALCLASAIAAGAAEQPEPTKALTFIEIRAAAVDRGREILRQYTTALRQHERSLSVTTLEEIGRPQRLVVLESATRAEELTRAEAAARPVLTSMDSLLTAPPDRRMNREFGDAADRELAGEPTAAVVVGALYVIAHLDLGPSDQASGMAALQRLIDAARHSPGNLRYEAWQQANRPNHFNLVASWSSRAQLDEFNSGAAAREFRASVAPLIGSPYDERLYQLIRSK